MAIRRGKHIRVLICNKYRLFREGIKALLPEGMPIELVGEAATAQEVLDLLTRLHPDVLLMDATVSDLSGSEALRRIKAIDPHVKVLILSLYDDEPLVATCVQAGASGHIGTHDSPRQLRNAISHVCQEAARAA